MQIYKKRDFGALISDTFLFLKQHGKNYFKNYLVINGGLMLLLLIIAVVGFRDIISQLYQSNMNNANQIFEQYFDQNFGIFITICILISVVGLFVWLMNFAFPIIYLDKMGKEKRSDFTVSEIVEALKKKMGRIFIFFLFSLFILLPMMMVVMGVTIASILLIIGFLLIFIVYPTLVNIFNFNMFDYLVTDNGVFKSFSNALSIQFSKKFWVYMATTLVMYIIIQVIVSVFAMVPGMMLGVQSTVSANTSDDFSVLMIITLILYVLSMLVSIILSNAIYICTGLMYFDARTDLHREEYYKEIDEIGKL